MKFENIGTNAGIVWRTLNNKDVELELDALVQETGLQMEEVAAAIGWLARENKIVIKQTDKNCVLTVYRECYY